MEKFPIIAGALDRMPNGVAKIQNCAIARQILFHRRKQCRALISMFRLIRSRKVDRSHSVMSLLKRGNISGSAMIACFMISANPCLNSRCGRLFRISMSSMTSEGWWIAPIRFFPGVGIYACLTADGTVDHRQKRRRNLNMRNSAMINRGDEA